jgi:ABC-type oligopeptide transport system ATPase subunit
VSREALLEVVDLHKTFPARRAKGGGAGDGRHVAVDGVSFRVDRAKTLGIIGESGSGKSTTARCVLRLIEPTSGSICFQGIDLLRLSKRELRSRRSQMQIVFQNPYNSLDPRRSVGSSIAEPLAAHRIGTRRSRAHRIGELLEQVGLDRRAARYRPQEFSGGERQRLGIARAIALEPALVVCDEPVSALDVSVQAQILNLLRDLQDELGIAYLFISHDIAVVRLVSEHVAVMKDGKIVESGKVDQICSRPAHSYTRSLLAAAHHTTPATTTENGRPNRDLSLTLDDQFI